MRGVFLRKGTRTLVRQDGDHWMFRLNQPCSEWVRLVGDFNNWSLNVSPMNREADGWWVIRLHLAPGRYRYRFLASDKGWIDERTHNPTGLDSLQIFAELHVPASDPPSRPADSPEWPVDPLRRCLDIASADFNHPTTQEGRWS